MPNKLSAFVIMPFDEEFNDVYAAFLKPVLEAAGFCVERANDIDSQQSILRDIVEKIVQSNLIVADLTKVNPNVFYELGLAHALRKPVILITQSIDEVPFDLQSYRLLEYSTHFTFIEKAKEQLKRSAEGFALGTVKFGSPITDFYSDGSPPHEVTEAIHSEPASEDQPGLLDHQIALSDGYERIASLAESVTDELNILNKHMVAATTEFQTIGSNPNSSSAKAARAVSRRLAKQIADYTSTLKGANDEYATIAQETDDSLEFVISFGLEHAASSDSSESDLADSLASLEQLEAAMVGARDAQREFAIQMNALPPLERRLNREVAQASDQTNIMAANLDKTIASISRVLKKYG